MRRLIVAVCLLVLMATLLLSGTSEAQALPVFMTLWGPTLSDGTTLVMPDGMDVNQSGQIHVLCEDGVIRLFSGSGTLLGTLTSQFPNCTGVTADDDGNVYVADLWAHCIHKLSSSGTPLLTWGTQGSGQYQFNHPFSIRHSRYNHRLYVSDQFNGRICMYTTDGAYVGAWGSVGTGPGQFNICYGVAIDSRNGRVIVMENNSTNVVRGQVFTPDGDFLFQFGAGGSGDGQFSHPLNAAVDAAGIIYVADKDNHRVVMFSESGGYLGTFGSRGSGPGQFRECHAIGADQSGHIFVADHTGGRIEAFGSGATPAMSTTWGRMKSLYRR